MESKNTGGFDQNSRAQSQQLETHNVSKSCCRNAKPSKVLLQRSFEHICGHVVSRRTSAAAVTHSSAAWLHYPMFSHVFPVCMQRSSEFSRDLRGCGHRSDKVLREQLRIDPTARIMYVFGGSNRAVEDSTPSSTFSDLFSYAPATDTWTELTSSETARYMHTAVWDSNSERMIAFGGLTDDKTKLNDVLEYSPGSDSWNAPAITGTKPRPREGHLAVWDTVSNVMLICCGQGDTSVYAASSKV